MRREVWLFHIWPGERQLLPSAPDGHYLLLHCLIGKAYLRVMSQSRRQVMRSGDKKEITAGEVATVSGVETMTLEIELRTQKGCSK